MKRIGVVIGLIVVFIYYKAIVDIWNNTPTNKTYCGKIIEKNISTKDVCRVVLFDEKENKSVSIKVNRQDYVNYKIDKTYCIETTNFNLD